MYVNSVHRPLSEGARVRDPRDRPARRLSFSNKQYPIHWVDNTESRILYSVSFARSLWMTARRQLARRRAGSGQFAVRFGSRLTCHDVVTSVESRDDNTSHVTERAAAVFTL